MIRHLAAESGDVLLEQRGAKLRESLRRRVIQRAEDRSRSCISRARMRAPRPYTVSKFLGESEAFWLEFLRSLRQRGLDGVRLAVSDDHQGLKAAIARVLACPWQRCTVHFVRSMHQHCRPAQRAIVSAALREVFNADSRAQARERVSELVERLAPVVPKVCALLEQAEDDLLAFYAFPGRALVEAPQHEPARARQPRDRPPLRRRRHLPQRRRGNPTRRRAPDRAER